MRTIAQTRVRRGITLVAGAAVAALALSACASGGGTNAGSGDPVKWELTATTPAPSGDIDSITWAAYAEPYSLDYAYAFERVRVVAAAEPGPHVDPESRRVV